MWLAFATSLPVTPFHREFRYQRRRRCARRHAYSHFIFASAAHPEANLYGVLGIDHPDPASLSTADVRKAYLAAAKIAHPDSAASPSLAFDQVARAWAVLGDPHLRNVYDSSGEEGLAAVESITKRSDDIRERFTSMSGEQLEYLSDTGQLVGAFLSASEADDFDPSSVTHDDACPRSVEEAIWNIENHEDPSVRYYGLWWIYKFKVEQAETALINVLQTSADRTSLGGFGLRRRAALALGAVASIPSETNQAAVLALSDALRSPDYFLRYRAAEALANIAQRSLYSRDVKPKFPEHVITQLQLILNTGRQRFEKDDESKSGFQQQESLFDLGRLDPQVRERLESVFENRRENEQRSRRTTMTPQLGVGEVGSESDEPYEWVLKAVSAICMQGFAPDAGLVETVEYYTQSSTPLIRYAAHKAMYSVTRDAFHAEEIVKALKYGMEHHYSQRVLIRDLGDLGYCQGAAAIAACPMVEHSFKILALKNMLASRMYDPMDAEVRNVLRHVDSLL